MLLDNVKVCENSSFIKRGVLQVFEQLKHFIILPIIQANAKETATY